MKSVNVITSIIINRPVEQVAAFAGDPDNAPKWYKNIKSVEWKTPKPLTIGSLVAFKAQFMGKELAYTYEITELVPAKKLVMRTSQGPFPMETTYEWEALPGNKTEMTLRNTGTPAGFSKLFSPFMEMAMKSANKKDLALLKQLLEK